MHIALLAGLKEKEEFFSRPIPSSVQVSVADSLRAFEAMEADAHFDLSFEVEYERRVGLSGFRQGILFVNDVCGYSIAGPTPVVRINGWPTFLKRDLVELSVTVDVQSGQVDDLFSKLGWKYQVVKNVPGFVTGRVVAALINEAYFTVGAHVSTKSEIDTAMKLGTNYPYGPFEWAELIGLEKVLALLRKLSATDERYVPAPALEIDLLVAAGIQGGYEQMKQLILNMDTSMPLASICLAEQGECIDILKNENQKDHAAWLHPAIEQLLRQTGYSLQQLDAIAVTAGPGSYTGLRVAMAAAKGFCFILKKPLILVNTLEVMALSAILAKGNESGTLYCPMIDARRMEVFACLYNEHLSECWPPAAIILDDNFDDRFPAEKKVIVFGNGSTKYSGRKMIVEGIVTDASHLAVLALARYKQKDFTPADQAVPFYGKAFLYTVCKIVAAVFVILVSYALQLDLLLYQFNSYPLNRCPLHYHFSSFKAPILMNVTSTYSMILNTPSTDGVSVKVDFLNLKKGAMILRSLNHKLRQQIIRLIDENKRMTVTEIYVRLRLEQSVASQHLAILRRAGIVKTERDGKFIYYSVNSPRVAHIMRCVEDLNKARE